VANAKFLVGATEGRGEAAVGDSGPANGLVEVVKTDEGSWKAQYVWRAKRATSSFGSPIAAGNTAYFINRVGVIYAADLATGAEHYAQRLGDSAWATPLAIGDRVFVFGKGGGATVIATGDTFQQLAENTCWVAEEKPATEAPAEGAAPGASGPVLYGVAYADGLLVIRKGDELICVGAAK
jgi:glucose dehydrogenase